MLAYFIRSKNKKGFALIELVVVIGIIGVMTAVAVPNILSSQRRAEAYRQNAHARGFYLAVHQTLTNVMQNDNSEREFMINNHYRVSGTDSFSSLGDGSPIVTINTNGTGPGMGLYFFLYMRIGPNSTAEFADLVLSSRADYISATANTPLATLDTTTLNNRPLRHTCTVACTPLPCAASATAATARRTYINGLAAPQRSLIELVEEIEGLSATSSETGHYYAMFDSDFRVIMAYYQSTTNTQRINGAAGNTFAVTQQNRVNNRTFGAFPLEYSFIGGFRTCPPTCPAMRSVTPCSDTAHFYTRNATGSWFGVNDGVGIIDYI
jgi:prepilin-type N-terminal cleavage/methylation domain-containing protein